MDGITQILKNIDDIVWGVPLIVLILSGALNVLLNLFFVIVLHRSVDGVALATVLSNAFSAAVLFVLLCRTKLPVRIRFGAFAVDRRMLPEILRIGIPSAVQGMVYQVGNMVIQTAVHSLGELSMAATAASMHLGSMIYAVPNAFGQACTTFTGQNYGAGKFERCRKTLHLSLLLSFIGTGIFTAAGLYFGRELMGLFSRDPEVIGMAYLRLLILIPFQVVNMIPEVFGGHLRGFGHSREPAWATMCGICGFRVLWTLAVFPRRRTFPVLLACYPLSFWVAAAIILIIYFRMRRSLYSPGSVIHG